MRDYDLSEHATYVLRERGIRESWVRLTLEDPERTERQVDGTAHYLRPIGEHGNRYLRVIVNPRTRPVRIVTAFFDRRVRRDG